MFKQKKVRELPGAWCPWCNGTGDTNFGDGYDSWHACWLCKGGGRVNLWRWLRLKLSYLRETLWSGATKNE